MAGTRGKLGLVKFNGHRIFIYLGEHAGVGIDIGTDFAEEFSACDKLGGDKDIYLICGDGAGTDLFFCAECDGVFLGVDFTDVKGNAACEANAPSLAKGVIGDSFMLGDFFALHISYIAALLKDSIGQYGAVVAFAGEAKFHTFQFFSDRQIGFGGDCADMLFGQIAQRQDEISETLRRYTVEKITLVFGVIFCFAEEKPVINFVNLSIMACSKISDTKFFLQEIPKDGEFQKGIAVNAGIGSQSCGVRLAKGFYYDFFEGLGNIGKIMRDGQLFADKGGIGPATGALAGVSRERDLHCDSEDVPALLLEEVCSGAAIDAAAHKDDDLLICLLRGLPREMA